MRNSEASWITRGTAAALFLLVSGGLCFAASQATLGEGVPLGVVRVTQSRLPVVIDNAMLVFDVGARLRLFQENEEFFIALSDAPYSGRQLIAVPLRKGTSKVAWVTPEQTMFFGFRTATVEGRLYLRVDEELSVIREDASRYEVLVERMGQQAAIWVSKLDPGIRFIPNPAAALKKDGGKASRQVRRPAQPPRPRVTNAAEAVAARVTAPAGDAAVPAGQESLPEDEVETAWMSLLAPEAETIPDEDAARASRAGSEEGSRIETMMRGMLSAVGARIRMLLVVVLAALLLIVLLVAGLRKAVLKHAHPAGLRKLKAKDEKAPASKPEPEPIAQAPSAAPPAADFSGTIASMALSAVTQFLNGDKETGVLTITENDHKVMGRMIFVDGEIVDARTDGKRGVDAVYAMLRFRQGLFAFVRQPAGKYEKTVNVGTISLLLEAHRVLDEEGEKKKAPVAESKPAAPAARVAAAQGRQTAAPPPEEKAKPKSGTGLRVKRPASH